MGRHHVDADPDTNFNFNADPGPDPDPSLSLTHVVRTEFFLLVKQCLFTLYYLSRKHHRCYNYQYFGQCMEIL